MPRSAFRPPARMPALVALLAFGFAGAAIAAAPPGHPVRASAPAAKASAAPLLVDINSAPRSQLEALPGIGKAEAERIVAGRPYRTKADLVTSKVLPAGLYLQIKSRIVARQPDRPGAAAAGGSAASAPRAAASAAKPTPKSRVQG